MIVNFITPNHEPLKNVFIFNKYNISYFISFKSQITTRNGVQEITKGCQLASTCSTFTNGDTINGQSQTCCTSSGCNTQQLTCPVVTTTIAPQPQISCYSVHCANCAANTLGVLTACPAGAFSCYVS